MSLGAARPLLPRLGLCLIFAEVEAKFFVSSIFITAITADNIDSYSVCPRLISNISISIFFHPHCSPLLPSLIHSIIHSISGKIKGSKNIQDGGIAIDRNSDWILVRDRKHPWLGMTGFFQNTVYVCREIQMSGHNRRTKAESSWLDTDWLESQLVPCQPREKTQKGPFHFHQLRTAVDLVLHCSQPHSEEKGRLAEKA